MLATVEVIMGAWVFGIDRLRSEIRRGANLEVPRPFWFIIKYISPVYLLAIFAFWCYKNLPERIGQIRSMDSEDSGTVLLILSFIVVLMVFFALMINLAGKRWVASGRLSYDLKADPLAADGHNSERNRP
jgi:NSS family neurotransmitter:Na+ symporter